MELIVENRDKQQKPQQKTPELIGKGSYGCVFYPGIACSGKPETVQYVTKVQKDSKETDHEKAVGDHIRKKRFPKYYDYFAPVMSTCPLKMASIKKDDINQCEVLQNADHQQDQQQTDLTHTNPFVSIKIRYVGNQTLKEHLMQRLLKDTPTFFGHMIETQLYLLNSLEKLEKAKVIHYDLKSNNIMFHEKIQNPVIIDFGMSILLEKLPVEQYHQTFFDHYEKYPPWCPDIMLISFVVKDKGWMKTKVTKDTITNMNQLIETYFTENPSIKPTEQTKQTKQIKQYWKTWIGTFENKNKTSMAKQLLENWQSWDTYSLVVIYYRFMKENVQMEAQAPFVDTYMKMHETYILSKPTERQSPKAMYHVLKKFSKSIDRKDFLKWNKSFVEYQKKPDVIDAEKESIKKDLEENKKAENILLQKKHEKSQEH